MATENHSSGCLDDPNFATICSFIEKFGEICNIATISFGQLQEMLENTSEVPLPLVQLHIQLLRRVFKSINTNKWEKSVSKFAHMFNSQDGWEIERFGYKKSKMQTKLRILKNLLESQFDYNNKFKGEVNKLPASDLRLVPLGRDSEGHSYWYQVDLEANLRVYREDVDEETWEVVASSREEMEQLIGQLKAGEIRKPKPVDDNTNEEDVQGLESMDIEPKEILLDTGKPAEDDINGNDDDDSIGFAGEDIDSDSFSDSMDIKDDCFIGHEIGDGEIKSLEEKIELDSKAELYTSQPEVKPLIHDQANSALDVHQKLKSVSSPIDTVVLVKSDVTELTNISVPPTEDVKTHEPAPAPIPELNSQIKTHVSNSNANQVEVSTGSVSVDVNSRIITSKTEPSQSKNKHPAKSPIATPKVPPRVSKVAREITSECKDDSKVERLQPQSNESDTPSNISNVSAINKNIFEYSPNLKTTSAISLVKGEADQMFKSKDIERQQPEPINDVTTAVNRSPYFSESSPVVDAIKSSLLIPPVAALAAAAKNPSTNFDMFVKHEAMRESPKPNLDSKLKYVRPDPEPMEVDSEIPLNIPLNVRHNPNLSKLADMLMEPQRISPFFMTHKGSDQATDLSIRPLIAELHDKKEQEARLRAKEAFPLQDGPEMRGLKKFHTDSRMKNKPEVRTKSSVPAFPIPGSSFGPSEVGSKRFPSKESSSMSQLIYAKKSEAVESLIVKTKAYLCGDRPGAAETSKISKREMSQQPKTVGAPHEPMYLPPAFMPSSLPPPLVTKHSRELTENFSRIPPISTRPYKDREHHIVPHVEAKKDEAFEIQAETVKQHFDKLHLPRDKAGGREEKLMKQPISTSRPELLDNVPSSSNIDDTTTTTRHKLFNMDMLRSSPNLPQMEKKLKLDMSLSSGSAVRPGYHSSGIGSSSVSSAVLPQSSRETMPHVKGDITFTSVDPVKEITHIPIPVPVILPQGHRAVRTGHSLSEKSPIKQLSSDAIRERSSYLDSVLSSRIFEAKSLTFPVSHVDEIKEVPVSDSPVILAHTEGHPPGVLHSSIVPSPKKRREPMSVSDLLYSSAAAKLEELPSVADAEVKTVSDKLEEPVSIFDLSVSSAPKIIKGHISSADLPIAPVSKKLEEPVSKSMVPVSPLPNKLKGPLSVVDLSVTTSATEKSEAGISRTIIPVPAKLPGFCSISVVSASENLKESVAIADDTSTSTSKTLPEPMSSATISVITPTKSEESVNISGVSSMSQASKKLAASIKLEKSAPEICAEKIAPEKPTPEKPTEKSASAKITEKSTPEIVKSLPEKPTEKSTPEMEKSASAKVAEKSTPDKPTEKPTPDKPTEKPTPEKPTEKPTPEKPTEKSTPEKPTEKSTPDMEKSTPEKEKSASAKVTEKSTPEKEKSASAKVTEKSTPEKEKSTLEKEKSTPEKPTEKSTPEKEKSTPEKPMEKSTPEKEKSTPEKPTEKSTPKKPTEKSTPEKPTEKSTPEKEKSTPEKPTEKSTPEKQTEKSTPEMEKSASAKISEKATPAMEKSTPEQQTEKSTPEMEKSASAKISEKSTPQMEKSAPKKPTEKSTPETQKKEATPEKPTGKSAPETQKKEATPEKTTEKATEKSTEKSNPQKRTPEKSAPEKLNSEKLTPEKPISQRSTPEKPTSEKRTPGTPNSENPASEKLIPEKQAPEKPTPENLTPDKLAPEKLIAKKSAPENLTPEKRAPEKSGARGFVLVTNADDSLEGTVSVSDNVVSSTSKKLEESVVAPETAVSCAQLQSMESISTLGRSCTSCDEKLAHSDFALNESAIPETEKLKEAGVEKVEDSFPIPWSDITSTQHSQQSEEAKLMSGISVILASKVDDTMANLSTIADSTQLGKSACKADSSNISPTVKFEESVSMSDSSIISSLAKMEESLSTPANIRAPASKVEEPVAISDVSAISSVSLKENVTTPIIVDQEKTEKHGAVSNIPVITSPIKVTDYVPTSDIVIACESQQSEDCLSSNIRGIPGSKPFKEPDSKSDSSSISRSARFEESVVIPKVSEKVEKPDPLLEESIIRVSENVEETVSMTDVEAIRNVKQLDEDEPMSGVEEIPEPKQIIDSVPMSGIESIGDVKKLDDDVVMSDIHIIPGSKEIGENLPMSRIESTSDSRRLGDNVHISNVEIIPTEKEVKDNVSISNIEVAPDVKTIADTDVPMSDIEETPYAKKVDGDIPVSIVESNPDGEKMRETLPLSDISIMPAKNVEEPESVLDSSVISFPQKVEESVPMPKDSIPPVPVKLEESILKPTISNVDIQEDPLPPACPPSVSLSSAVEKFEPTSAANVAAITPSAEVKEPVVISASEKLEVVPDAVDHLAAEILDKPDSVLTTSAIKVSELKEAEVLVTARDSVSCSSPVPEKAEEPTKVLEGAVTVPIEMSVLKETSTKVLETSLSKALMEGATMGVPDTPSVPSESVERTPSVKIDQNPSAIATSAAEECSVAASDDNRNTIELSPTNESNVGDEPGKLSLVQEKSSDVPKVAASIPAIPQQTEDHLLKVASEGRPSNYETATCKKEIITDAMENEILLEAKSIESANESLGSANVKEKLIEPKETELLSIPAKISVPIYDKNKPDVTENTEKSKDTLEPLDSSVGLSQPPTADSITTNKTTVEVSEKVSGPTVQTQNAEASAICAEPATVEPMLSVPQVATESPSTTAATKVKDISESERSLCGLNSEAAPVKSIVMETIPTDTAKDTSSSDLQPLKLNSPSKDIEKVSQSLVTPVSQASPLPSTKTGTVVCDDKSNSVVAEKVTPKVEKPKIIGLVGYEYSDSEEEEDDGNITAPAVVIASQQSQHAEGVSGPHKRKLEAEPDSTSEQQQPKILKMASTLPIDNPIVGEAIEESVFIVTGSGEGALNEGGNESPSGSPLPEDSQEEALQNEEQQNSPAGGHLPPKPKGRGRPRKAQTKEVLRDKNFPETKSSPVVKPASRRNSLNLSEDVNGAAASGPVRRSGRVAQIRQKEEEERRKLEEERLAQLKNAQIRKQQKQMERELKTGKQPPKPPKQPKAPKIPKTPKAPKGSKHETYIPPSESESDSEQEEEEDADEYDGSRKPAKRRRKRKTKNGKPVKRGGNPWLHSSSEDDEAIEEEEEEHYEEEEEEDELIFNGSDHEFSPESDIGEDSEFSPSRHARTAKTKEAAVDKYAETYCDKCGKGDHPEWILLCDQCDKGWHASCVNPQLWVIPEGEWFCPPCQHLMLVDKLSENLIEYDKILKKRENEVLRKQRLAYVGISLNNVLPSAEKPPTDKSDEEHEANVKHSRNRSSRRRRIYSDEELEDFINDKDDDDFSESQSGSYESEEEPMYQLRARRATKGFSFQEYDDMINTALRGDSPEPEEEKPAEPTEIIKNGISDEAEEQRASKEENAEKGKDASEDDDEKIPAPRKVNPIKDDDSDDEELDEKEKNRRQILNQGQKKNRRRLNDLDATSEEDSDEDFKGSADDYDDEDEENVVEDSDWSDDESDDSIAMAKIAKKKRRHHGPLGRQVKCLDGETVRRSTRRKKSRVIYDESDQDEDEDDQEEKWQSGESEISESDSESDDETWGKKKKQKKAIGASKSKLPNFFLQDNKVKKPKKKKKRRMDEDDVDRAWTNKFGKGRKLADEPVERKTRGKQINFKDILDSGESDDDGNIRPKRRRILSDSDDDGDGETPGSSRKLVEEIRAANARQAAEEKLQHEEKMREIAKAEKQMKKEQAGLIRAHKSHPISIPLTASIEAAAEAAAALDSLPSSELHPMLLESEKERPIKITNSIVESILLSKKSPILPDSPPSPIPPAISIAMTNDPLMNLPPPPLSSLSQPVYLPTVIPGSGSARVGKKKTASMLPTPASTNDVLPFPSSKKTNSTGVSFPGKSALGVTLLPPSSSPPILPPNMPSDLTRIAGPMYPSNPALRQFHPAWGRSPPPYAGPHPPALGKPPPLNSSSFMPQPGQLRSPSSYPQSSPSLRIPNPNTLQAFQQFSKRSGGDVGGPHYRMGSPHQLPSGSVLPPITRDRERVFLGGSSPYAPYGIIPPQSQGQQHPALFVPPFDYRAPEPFKDEPIERQSLPLERQSQPPPPTSAVPSSGSSGPVVKDEGNPGSQGDGEFGGLVSYFSSQHSNDED